jgi:hypothetical protein
MMENDQSLHNDTEEEKPPILSSWRRLYSLVLLNLIALIVIFYIFTQIFQ